jgi:hypothetical protein
MRLIPVNKILKKVDRYNEYPISPAWADGIWMGFEYEIDTGWDRFDIADEYDDGERRQPSVSFDEKSNRYVVTKLPERTNKKLQYRNRQYHLYIPYALWESTGEHDCLELKSAICSLRAHKAAFKSLNKDFDLDYAEGLGIHNDGGLHVNVSVESRGDFRRVAEYLHDPDKFDTDLAVALSGRDEDSFEEYSPQRGSAVLNGWRDRWPWGDYSAVQSHYNIINAEKDNRYEFRMYRASSDLLLPALEHAHSLFALTDEDKGEITTEKWIDYLNTHKERYSNILNRYNKVA